MEHQKMEHPNMAIFGQVTGKNKTKNLQETDFWFFDFFRIFWDFLPKNPEKSRNWDFSVGLNPENHKISKICFLQIFCFCFAYNLAKNGQNWVIWWKVIRFFRWKKINFFIVFSMIFHTNTLKTARSAQLRDIISLQQTIFFSFCKKHKSSYNPNFKIC